MDVTNGAALFAIALVFMAAIITKAARARIKVDPVCNRPPPPPVVNSISTIGLLRTFFTKGPQAMISDQYTKLGSVFTISFVGVKITFLVGPDVSGHFFEGLDTEIGPFLPEFMVPMILGKGAVLEFEENRRIFINAYKAVKLRSHVGPMLQEVEDYFKKWGDQGTVDIKQELENIFMLTSGRCLIGKEVHEKVFDEFFTLFHEMIYNGMHLGSIVFPYAPIPMNHRRDRARAKLSEIITNIARSRKSSEQADQADVLQKIVESTHGDGRPMSDSDITGMVIALLLAGMHSSSTTGMWTGARLLNHPKFLAAAVEEQKNLIRKYGDHIDYNVLVEMDTLYCCIKEALRMHALMPVLIRRVHKDFTVQTKEGIVYEIPRGHTTISPVQFTSNMPWIYKEPNTYDPERFGAAREEDKVGGKFSYTSFGGGRHICVGEAFAYIQIKAIWSHLLRNFELEMVSPFPQTNWNKLVPQPKGKVMVNYKRRLLSST